MKLQGHSRMFANSGVVHHQKGAPRCRGGKPFFQPVHLGIAYRTDEP